MSACAWSALSSFSRLVIPSFVSTLQISTPPPSPLSHSLRFSSSPISTFYRCRRNSESSYITRSKDSIKEGFWEEADDGFGSEDDELEEELGEGQNESASEGANTARHSNLEYERLVEGVEHLLEPKERDILQQNEFFDISKISTKKWSIFHSLGLSLQISLMDELLQHGWDIDYVDADGYTSLHMAVIGKKEAVISHLLRKGANPVVRDRDGATALHYAVQAGAMQTVKLLIRYKADVNVADNDGWTPLHISMQSRSRDIAKVLLINGADKMRRTKDGKTPLDLCLCYGRDFKSYDLAKLLKLVPANRNV